MVISKDSFRELNWWSRPVHPISTLIRSLSFSLDRFSAAFLSQLHPNSGSLSRINGSRRPAEASFAITCKELLATFLGLRYVASSCHIATFFA